MPARPAKKIKTTTTLGNKNSRALNPSAAKSRSKRATPAAKAARIAASGANSRQRGHQKASAARAQARRDSK